MDEQMTSFGQNLREQRKRKGLTQTDQVLGLCRELSNDGIAEWIALGNTIKDFPHNRR